MSEERTGSTWPEAGPLLTLADVSRSYGSGSGRVQAVHCVSVGVHAGEMLALVGPSGSGKSTLLFITAGWEEPDTGEIFLHPALSATSVAKLPWWELAVVPQSLGLLDELTVAENVVLPARLGGFLGGGAGEERAAGLLARLDLDILSERRPSEVSLGEQQRAALARALLLEPVILIVDEPTTHQDRKRADRVFEELHRGAEAGAAIIVATHDEEILDHADRVLEMRDGVGTLGTTEGR